MSSISFSITRKRSHSPDFSGSSDSEDEAPPFKLKRKNSGTKVPQAFAVRLRNLVSWISDLPVKDFFKMAVKAGSALPEEEIVIDDDDDDIIVLDEREGAFLCQSAPHFVKKDDERKANPFVQRLEQLKKHKISNTQRLSRQLEVNGTTRYQTRGSEVICYYDSRDDSHKIRNGSNSAGWTPKYCGNGSYNLRPFQAEIPSDIISNPPTDIDIFLESATITSSSEPELEIIEEPSDGRCGEPTSVQFIHTDLPARLATVRSISRPGPTHSRLHSALKPYTAHEVVRLQEKAQYQALLEKYINGNQYRNVSEKPKMNENKVDSTSFAFSGDHFKKEVLQQPISSFLNKYFKPCHLIPSAEKSKEPIEIVIDGDDDEEEKKKFANIELPKYKPKYRQKPNFFSADWINELRSSVNTQSEECLKIVHKHERALERYKKERLLERLSGEVGDSEFADPEFPDLTPEMDEVIFKALVGDPEEMVCKTKGDNLHRKDIETLSGLNWVNDLIINTYMDLVVSRSTQEGYLPVFAFNTFFYPSLKSKGYSAVRRWTRRIDLFSFDLNIIPIHLGLHWCLAVIDHRSKKICYYDSMGSAESTCLELLHSYLCMEHMDKRDTPLDPASYTCEIMKNIPHQMNGCDCGMFTMKYAEYLSRGVELTFNQKHMQYFRRRTIYELVTQKLL